MTCEHDFILGSTNIISEIAIDVVFQLILIGKADVYF